MITIILHTSTTRQTYPRILFCLLNRYCGIAWHVSQSAQSDDLHQSWASSLLGSDKRELPLILF